MGGNASSQTEELGSTQNKNLRFYRNEIKSGDKWTGHYIQDMLTWHGHYNKLETTNCVHWLFPIPSSAGQGDHPLLEIEAKAIREDDVTRGRFLQAYKMMLEFFGMRLYSEDTGKVVRHYNYLDRYCHLVRNTHNFRCITRILTSLGELGYEGYQAPWVKFLIVEVVLDKLLQGVNSENIKFWINAIKNEKDRRCMNKNYYILTTEPLKPFASRVFYVDDTNESFCTSSSSLKLNEDVADDETTRFSYSDLLKTSSKSPTVNEKYAADKLYLVEWKQSSSRLGGPTTDNNILEKTNSDPTSSKQLFLQRRDKKKRDKSVPNERIEKSIHVDKIPETKREAYSGKGKPSLPRLTIEVNSNKKETNVMSKNRDFNINIPRTSSKSSDMNEDDENDFPLLRRNDCDQASSMLDGQMAKSDSPNKNNHDLESIKQPSLLTSGETKVNNKMAYEKKGENYDETEKYSRNPFRAFRINDDENKLRNRSPRGGNDKPELTFLLPKDNLRKQGKTETTVQNKTNRFSYSNYESTKSSPLNENKAADKISPRHVGRKQFSSRLDHRTSDNDKLEKTDDSLTSSKHSFLSFMNTRDEKKKDKRVPNERIEKSIHVDKILETKREAYSMIVKPSLARLTTEVNSNKKETNVMSKNRDFKINMPRASSKSRDMNEDDENDFPLLRRNDCDQASSRLDGQMAKIDLPSKNNQDFETIKQPSLLTSGETKVNNKMAYERKGENYDETEQYSRNPFRAFRINDDENKLRNRSPRGGNDKPNLNFLLPKDNLRSLEKTEISVQNKTKIFSYLNYESSKSSLLNENKAADEISPRHVGLIHSSSRLDAQTADNDKLENTDDGLTSSKQPFLQTRDEKKMNRGVPNRRVENSIVKKTETKQEGHSGKGKPSLLRLTTEVNSKKNETNIVNKSRDFNIKMPRASSKSSDMNEDDEDDFPLLRRNDWKQASSRLDGQMAENDSPNKNNHGLTAIKQSSLLTSGETKVNNKMAYERKGENYDETEQYSRNPFRAFRINDDENKPRRRSPRRGDDKPNLNFLLAKDNLRRLGKTETSVQNKTKRFSYSNYESTKSSPLNENKAADEISPRHVGLIHSSSRLYAQTADNDKLENTDDGLTSSKQPFLQTRDEKKMNRRVPNRRMENSIVKKTETKQEGHSGKGKPSLLRLTTEVNSKKNETNIVNKSRDFNIKMPRASSKSSDMNEDDEDDFPLLRRNDWKQASSRLDGQMAENDSPNKNNHDLEAIKQSSLLTSGETKVNNKMAYERKGENYDETEQYSRNPFRAFRINDDENKPRRRSPRRGDDKPNLNFLLAKDNLRRLGKTETSVQNKTKRFSYSNYESTKSSPLNENKAADEISPRHVGLIHSSSRLDAQTADNDKLENTDDGLTSSKQPFLQTRDEKKMNRGVPNRRMENSIVKKTETKQEGHSGKGKPSLLRLTTEVNSKKNETNIVNKSRDFNIKMPRASSKSSDMNEDDEDDFPLLRRNDWKQASSRLDGQMAENDSPNKNNHGLTAIKQSSLLTSGETKVNNKMAYERKGENYDETEQYSRNPFRAFRINDDENKPRRRSPRRGDDKPNLNFLLAKDNLRRLGKTETSVQNKTKRFSYSNYESTKSSPLNENKAADEISPRHVGLIHSSSRLDAQTADNDKLENTDDGLNGNAPVSKNEKMPLFRHRYAKFHSRSQDDIDICVENKHDLSACQLVQSASKESLTTHSSFFSINDDQRSLRHRRTQKWIFSGYEYDRQLDHWTSRSSPCPFETDIRRSRPEKDIVIRAETKKNTNMQLFGLSTEGFGSHSNEYDRTSNLNLRFYRNEIKSNGLTGHYIKEMLKWRGDYEKLENANCVHWLFPMPSSAGHSDHPLQEIETKAIREDDVTCGRFLEAYTMKLDFFGMRLYSEETGKIVRHYKYKERYNHLNRNTHNYRCITRILISLGELGYERFQVPWVIFLIDEVVIHKLLPSVNLYNMTFWINAIKNTQDRLRVEEACRNLISNPVESNIHSISEILYKDNVSVQSGDREHSSFGSCTQRSDTDSPKKPPHSKNIIKPSLEASDGPDINRPCRRKGQKAKGRLHRMKRTALDEGYGKRNEENKVNNSTKSEGNGKNNVKDGKTYQGNGENKASDGTTSEGNAENSCKNEVIRRVPKRAEGNVNTATDSPTLQDNSRRRNWYEFKHSGSYNSITSTESLLHYTERSFAADGKISRSSSTHSLAYSMH